MSLSKSTKKYKKKGKRSPDDLSDFEFYRDLEGKGGDGDSNDVLRSLTNG